VPGFSAEPLAASNGVLFFNEYPDVFAVDEATGAQLWTFEGLGGTTPTLAAGLAFVPAIKLLALDAGTGALVWNFQSPVLRAVIANRVVYASALSGEWDAFDTRNGSLLWSVTISSGCFGGCTDAVPVVANGTLYLAGPDPYLRAYSAPAEGDHIGVSSQEKK